MIGNDLAKAIKAHKGKVFVSVDLEWKPLIEVVKKDLIAYFVRCGNDETGRKLEIQPSGAAYVVRDEG